MTEPNSSTLQKPDPDEPSTELAQCCKPHGPDLRTRGRTTFTDGVVEKIAGIAARGVPGNGFGDLADHGFGSGVGALVDRQFPIVRCSGARYFSAADRTCEAVTFATRSDRFISMS